MVPYIGKMAVEQRKWLDEETFRDGVALCQTIPGATAMQTAAYVGFRAGGVAGAAASFIGFGLPAFLLMVGLSAFYARSQTLPPAVSVFNGLQTIVVAIVANAAVSFGKTLKGFKDVIIAVIAASMFAFGLSPILVILLAALLGFILHPTNSPLRVRFSAETQSSPAKPLSIIASLAALAFIGLFFFERKLFDLAAMMFRIDLFAFGGGFASVPLMFHEIVEAQLLDGWANISKWNCLGADYSGADRDNRDLRGLYALWPDRCSGGHSERIFAVFPDCDWSYSVF